MVRSVLYNYTLAGICVCANLYIDKYRYEVKEFIDFISLVGKAE